MTLVPPLRTPILAAATIFPPPAIKWYRDIPFPAMFS